MGKIAFVFAGQGAQYTGMGKELYESSPAARKVFDLADAIRPGTSNQCFSASKEELSRTLNTQPCLFAVDAACAAALTEKGIYADSAAGFSLGELAAAQFAGIAPFEEMFRLVIKRAQYMDDACASSDPTAMAAILRLTAEQVEGVCREFDSVYPVNYNSPGQTVVSGDARQIDLLTARVAELKGRAMKLPVSGAFHSPYMHSAAEKLKGDLESMTFAAPRIPLYANRTAQPYGDAVQLLSEQVENPVRWEQTVRAMITDGVDTFVECGAGKTLSGLIARIDGNVKVCRAEDDATLADALAKIGGEA